MTAPRRTGNVRRVVCAAVLAALLAACSGSSDTAAPADPERPTAVPTAQPSAETPTAVPPEFVCTGSTDHSSVARAWNEANLAAIRLDEPNPTVHARNLFHLSAAMWDAWAAYEPSATGLFVDETLTADDVDAARIDAINHAAATVLVARYNNAEGRRATLDNLDAVMAELCGVGVVDAVAATPPGSAAEAGVRIGQTVLDMSFEDGSLERLGYEDVTYRPVNPPLVLGGETGPALVDPNRWQPLDLAVAIAQNGLPLPGGEQVFLGSNWGSVQTFALPASADGLPLDPGPPPLLGGEGDQAYRDAIIEVLRVSGQLEAGDATLNISPGARGNNTVGTNDGNGHSQNPVTGRPYTPNVVDRADYLRAIAEFWADGPDSETPPGHWNTLANEASDALDADDLRIGGQGPAVPRLEWDIKLYLALNGALHDAAVAGWGTKAYYDYIRPISIVRHMASLGQSSVPDDTTTFHPEGLPLVDGVTQLITTENTAQGGALEGLRPWVGEVAVLAWQGSPGDPETQVAGVGWYPARYWVPYQRPTFVTPSFAAYVSGHSVFSRTAAQILTTFTGSPWFPGGLGEHTVPQGAFLHEDGPTETITLQWATWGDAADEAGYSRIAGGIHVRADDFAGRLMGLDVAAAAWEKASVLFAGG